MDTVKCGCMTIEQAASMYGKMVKCKWLTPDGNDWLYKEMTVNAHFLKEMEQGSIKDVYPQQTCLHTRRTTHFSDVFGPYETCLDCGETL